VCGAERRTFAELDLRANRVAHQLIESGVQPGEHVGVHMRNSVQFVESLLGCLKARAVPINVNFRYTDTELTYLYTNAELVATIVDGEFAEIVAAVLPSCPKVHTVLTLGAVAEHVVWPEVAVSDFEEAVAAQSQARDLPERSPQDHYVIYTGGTTGMPKGVVWRHEDFFYAALAGGNPYGDPYSNGTDMGKAAAANESTMSFLVTAPLMHGAAVYALFTGFFMGGKQVLMRDFDAVEALRIIQDESIAVLMIVGDAMARPVADAIAAHGSEYDLSTLMMIGSGGALWSRSVREQLLALMPNLYLRDGFGASESGNDGTLEVDDAGTMRLAFNPNVAVVDEHLRPLAPGTDASGYIARSGHVPVGYFNDPEKSAATFPVVDGVRMSILGDLGRIEADGSIVLLGRGSMCINSGGEKVFPEEVEQALKSHPDVMDALVAGAPDDRFGERVSAVIQLRDVEAEADLDAIRAHCRTKIAGYKVPKSLVVVPQILRSPSGKADYRWAKATVAQG
ncbi:MAG: acyl-CoA synthetase, partial [Mycobacteriaceae bacterium]